MDVFVARQPIFDRLQRIFAYELLFRHGQTNVYTATDGDKATAHVIVNSLWLIGLNTMTGGKLAFINFTANLLTDEIVTILPREQIVVEILETVEPTPLVLEACRNLRNMGFLVALDDFVFEPRFEPFLDIADIIKIDFTLTNITEQQQLIDRCQGTRIKFLAEKVETQEQFHQALAMGYSYFQGYFFSKPIIVKGQDIPSTKVAGFQMLQEANIRPVELERLERIIQRDLSLSYKLLKFINSPAFGLRSKVSSIRQALALLGTQEVVKWTSLMITRGLALDKPNELVAVSIVRARFCELIITEMGHKERSADAFLMGLFSLMDALLDRPLNEIMAELPVDDDVKEALMGRAGVFRNTYNLVVAYETGDWHTVSRYSTMLKIPEKRLPALHVNSLSWAREIM